MSLLAGSNTVKGTINDGMDVEFAQKLGKTVGKIYGSPVAVAMDGRSSNMMLKTAVVAGIMSVGSDVLDLGAVPTPMIQYYMATHPEVKGGVSITASFAGQQINGFRIMKAEGIDDPIFEEHTVDDIMSDNTQVPESQVGEISWISDFTEPYINSILSGVDVDAIRAAGLKICLDCRNSTVASTVSQLLMMLSIECIFISGDSSVLDEDRQLKLGHVVVSQGLDLGVAIDMDVDHILFATADGIPVHGDKSFAVFAKDILSKNKGKVVVPVNASTLMESIVRENGGELVLCNVGEYTVISKVKEYSAVLGGDIFGCIVMPGPACFCDAIQAMVKMFEIIAKNGPLEDQISRYPDYFIMRDSVKVPEEKIPAVLDRFKAMHEGEELELQDGVKVYNPEGWILVRESNVRDVIKVYTQSGSRDKSSIWMSETLKVLENILSSLDSSPAPQ